MFLMNPRGKSVSLISNMKSNAVAIVILCGCRRNCQGLHAVVRFSPGGSPSRVKPYNVTGWHHTHRCLQGVCCNLLRGWSHWVPPFQQIVEWNIWQRFVSTGKLYWSFIWIVLDRETLPICYLCGIAQILWPATTQIIPLLVFVCTCNRAARCRSVAPVCLHATCYSKTCTQ